MVDAGVCANPETHKNEWMQKVDEIFFLATLKKPENKFQLSGGKKGTHSEYMGYILNDMQYLTNRYPEAKW